MREHYTEGVHSLEVFLQPCIVVVFKEENKVAERMDHSFLYNLLCPKNVSPSSVLIIEEGTQCHKLWHSMWKLMQDIRSLNVCMHCLFVWEGKK